MVHFTVQKPCLVGQARVSSTLVHKLGSYAHFIDYTWVLIQQS